MRKFLLVRRRSLVLLVYARQESRIYRACSSTLGVQIVPGLVMKRTLIWCLLGLVSSVSAAGSQAQKIGETEKAVAALEQQWLKAQKTSNPDLLAPLLADNLISTSPDGKVTGKAETLADVKSQK